MHGSWQVKVGDPIYSSLIILTISQLPYLFNPFHQTLMISNHF
jgi:hypothetical protein